tara:strand:+ start:128 stop:1234 length:1107 start_codon:yes stop_codon:yes gene_type:complete
MAITNKLKFITQEKTTESTTTEGAFIAQGTILDATKLTAGHDYVMIGWVNCTSPGTNDGATKFAFESDPEQDLVGSLYQRHDTNSSGMYVGHIGQFVCPTPPASIGVYRRRVTGSNDEQTSYGQCFAIDLSYSGVSGGLASGTDFSSSQNLASRTVATNGLLDTHTVNNDNGTNLVLSITKIYDSMDSVLVGLYINDVLVSSGSRYVTDGADMKSVLFAGAYNLSNGDTVKMKNLDVHSATTDYTYTFTLNLGAAATQHTGQLTNWNEYPGSGSWGTATIDGNGHESFVVGMGRQTVTGAESGRMAGISLKNNTSNKWLLFNSRPSGEFNPIYFPATNPGATVGQFETAVIVGVGDIGDSDTIEMVTI